MDAEDNVIMAMFYDEPFINLINPSGVVMVSSPTEMSPRVITGLQKGTSFYEVVHRKKAVVALLNEITFIFAKKKDEARLLGKTLEYNVLQNIIDEYKLLQNLPDVVVNRDTIHRHVYRKKLICHCTRS